MENCLKMTVKKEKQLIKPSDEFDFSIPNYSFDQKNEVLKRRSWDDKTRPHAERLYKQVVFKDRYGYRKLDYAFRNAAWNIEFAYAHGTVQSNSGLYSWSEIADKARLAVETGEPVNNSPSVNSRIIKKAAKFYGADLVGICKVHKNLVYSHEYNPMTNEHLPLEIPDDCSYAIVIAVEMDYESVKYSPDAISGASTGLGYSIQAVVANYVAAFIRGLGYKALPCGNDTALSIPLAMAAGLGETGRSGILITQKFGPRVRLCKVFTNLPLKSDSFRPFGVKKFCKTCKKCAKHCPSQAISFENQTVEGPTISNHSGILKWYINPEKCFAYWAKNRMDCNNCVNACPFNKPSGILHDMARIFIKRVSILNRLFIKIDDIMGYGKPMKKKKYWEKI